MNFFEKVAEAAKKISELGIPTIERIPNRQEVRFYRSLERRHEWKAQHLKWRIVQMIMRPTAHKMPPAPIKMYRNRALTSAQVATGEQS